MKMIKLLSALQNLSHAELNSVLKEIDNLKNSLSIKKQEIIAFAKERGVTLTEDDLIAIHEKDGRRDVAPKYVYIDENDNKFEWSGRGKKPVWAKKMGDKKLSMYKV